MLFQLVTENYLFRSCCDPTVTFYLTINGTLIPGQAFYVETLSFSGCAEVVTKSVSGGSYTLIVGPDDCENCVKNYPCVTPTPTQTPTQTPTPSFTVTPTVTTTKTLTPTRTPTKTSTPTPTQTITNTITSSVTPTVTPTNTVTPTVTPTVTTTSITPTPTPTYTPTKTSYPAGKLTGIYQRITGANECTVVTIIPLSASCVSSDSSSINSYDGSINISLTGGTPPYLTTWYVKPYGSSTVETLGYTGQSATNLFPGSYTAVTVDFWGDFTAYTYCTVEFYVPTPTPTVTQTPTKFTGKELATFCLFFQVFGGGRSQTYTNFNLQFIRNNSVPLYNGKPQFVCVTLGAYYDWIVKWDGNKWILTDSVGIQSNVGGLPNTTTFQPIPNTPSDPYIPIGQWTPLILNSLPIYEVFSVAGNCPRQILPSQTPQATAGTTPTPTSTQTSTPTPTPTPTVGTIAPTPPPTPTNTPTITKTTTNTPSVSPSANYTGVRHVFKKCDGSLVINQSTSINVQVTLPDGTICTDFDTQFSPCFGFQLPNALCFNPAVYDTNLPYYDPTCPELGPPKSFPVTANSNRLFGWKNPNTDQWEEWSYLGTFLNQSQFNIYANSNIYPQGIPLLQLNGDYFSQNGTYNLDQSNYFAPCKSINIVETFPNSGIFVYDFDFGFINCGVLETEIIEYVDYLGGLRFAQDRSLTTFIDVQQPQCGCDGSILATSIGTPPYQYSIDGGTNYVNSPIFVGLCPNNYQVQIYDASGYTYVETITLDPPQNQTNFDLQFNVTESVIFDGLDGLGRRKKKKRLTWSINGLSLTSPQSMMLTISHTNVLNTSPYNFTSSTTPVSATTTSVFYDNGIPNYGTLVSTITGSSTPNIFNCVFNTNYPAPLQQLTTTKNETWTVLVNPGDFIGGQVESEIIVDLAQVNNNCIVAQSIDYIQILSANVMGCTCGCSSTFDAPISMINSIGFNLNQTTVQS